jgi:hypothetical protein
MTPTLETFDLLPCRRGIAGIASDWVEETTGDLVLAAALRSGIYTPSPHFADGAGDGSGYGYGYGDGDGDGDG